ncbi:hypothetical protein F5884DRAFT_771822 [Xylogone sp. PMI_703]|nr:hypothetical protein F5884DRAFT_771822 [Xylogone sp. PMI_703]
MLGLPASSFFTILGHGIFPGQILNMAYYLCSCNGRRITIYHIVVTKRQHRENYLSKSSNYHTYLQYVNLFPNVT